MNRDSNKNDPRSSNIDLYSAFSARFLLRTFSWAVGPGYDKYRHDFNKLIWKNVSPKWDFDDATFDRTAASFNNPDHVAIVIHNYRWRLSLAKGEPRYDDLEQNLFKGPVISVPTITIASALTWLSVDTISCAAPDTA